METSFRTFIPTTKQKYWDLLPIIFAHICVFCVDDGRSWKHKNKQISTEIKSVPGPRATANRYRSRQNTHTHTHTWSLACSKWKILLQKHKHHTCRCTKHIYAYMRIHQWMCIILVPLHSTNTHTQMVVESLSQGSKVSVPNSKDVFIREDRDQLEYRLCSNQKDPCNYTADQWKRQIPAGEENRLKTGSHCL